MSNYQKDLLSNQEQNRLLSLCKEQEVEIESFEKSTSHTNVFQKHPEVKITQPYIFNKDKTIAMGVAYNPTDHFWQFVNGVFYNSFPLPKSFNPFKGEYTKGDPKNEYLGSKIGPNPPSSQMFKKLMEYSSWNGHGLTNLNEVIDFIKWYTSKSI